MDAVNMAYYQIDDTTKADPIAGELGVLQAQSTGLEFLRLAQRAEQEADQAEDEEDPGGRGAARAARRNGWGGSLDSARRTVIKLTTSSHRALLKKLPEMMFQMQYGHECCCSHDTWTLYCKGIVALAYQASSAVNEENDFWTDPRADHI